MRISTDKDDSGYRAWCELQADGKTARVYLDDVEQHEMTTLDEDQGFIIRLVRSADGNLVTDIVRDEILKETVFGVVRVEIA